MHSNRIEGLERLENTLIEDDILFESFVQSLSVTVTELFRDPLFFASLRKNVLLRLATYPIIKIWIAGCATGQEVFSVAILLRETNLLERSIIYATDINQQSLATARQGIYPAHDLSKYEYNYVGSGGTGKLSDYFIESQGSILFDKTLTEKSDSTLLIIWLPINLYNEFQLILCRNVIMYFDKGLQDKVTQLFFRQPLPVWFHWLGDKESFHLSTFRSAFENVDRIQKIYRKITSS
ncbi:MAG: CheR family methyltransferase [Bacteroidota bacterium]